MALRSMAHSFIELDKDVVHVISNAEEAEIERLYEDLHLSEVWVDSGMPQGHGH